jgi:tripartite-type tricarboxylate transporter receptor subunit TctC
MLLTSSTTFATLPSLCAEPQARIEQFMPITMVMRAHMVLYCSIAVPATTVAEFIRYAKTQPEPILYGANLGAIGHLCGEMMKQKVGIQMTDIHYRSSIMLQQMLLRNDVQTGFDGVPAHAGLVADGKLRALGVTGDQHIPLLPGMPTLAEAGYPGIAIGTAFSRPRAHRNRSSSGLSTLCTGRRPRAISASSSNRRVPRSRAIRQPISPL